MKKYFYAKVALLLLFVLCIFSITIITTKETKTKTIETKAIQKIEGIIAEEYTINANCNGEVWFLVIPSINVKAPIKEGVGQEVLKYWIGHFEETSSWKRKCSTCFA